MENLPLISVIVPVYQVEAYLDKCISSITRQTYTNLEIILVDDGSPDRCGAMCDDWARLDSRIKTIHKKNGGLSDARNAGMAIATGELIGFVDSDDHISPDMYQLLYEHMMREECDISACGVKMVWEDGTSSRTLTKAGHVVLDTRNAMEAMIRETWLKQPVWYKLYKAELIRDIPFVVGKYHEDVFWSYQAVGRARRVAVFDTPCYFYTQRSGSIMGESYSLKRLDALEAKTARIEYVRQRFPELLGIAMRDLWGMCIFATQMLLRCCPKETQKEGAAIIGNALRQYPIRFSLLDWKEPKQCIWMSIAKISLKMTGKIRNRLGIGL